MLKNQPNNALLALYERDIEAGIDPLHVPRDVPVIAPTPWRPPQPDWEHEPEAVVIGVSHRIGAGDVEVEP